MKIIIRFFYYFFLIFILINSKFELNLFANPLNLETFDQIYSYINGSLEEKEIGRNLLKEILQKLESNSINKENLYLLLVQVDFSIAQQKKSSFNETLSTIEYGKKVCTGLRLEELEKLEALVHYYLANYQTSIELFHRNKAKKQVQDADELFFLSLAYEKLGKEKSSIRELRKEIFTKFPHSNYAPEAYFFYYDFQDYLNANKDIIKHLQNFITFYPHSPYVMYAYYFFGLNYKKKSELNEKGTRKYLLKALHAFQNGENFYYQNGSNFKIREKDDFLFLKYKMKLEEAIIKDHLAKKGFKEDQSAYFELAKKDLMILTEELDPLICDTNYFSIWEESQYLLANFYSDENPSEKSRKILSRMEKIYQEKNITKGYYLAKTYESLGKSYFKNKEYNQALEYMKMAEEASSPSFFSDDERLTLKIAISQLFEEMGQNDLALLNLSNVVNDESASFIRLKGMYLRALLYEKMQKKEFARKQLESLALKEGFWAKQAKERLNSYLDN
ncbi:MAG: hypothetical protein BGO10_07985 [Chlamydia sp. 32-24]|nr:MAG: hypothetical protein BGO10_07985 [Chlamydia sp. 32-24]